MVDFEVIDISGDAGIRAYGETLEELFISAATGMYSLITDIGDVRERKDVSISVESHSIEGLLVSWLNELIFYFDAYGFIGRRIVIAELRGKEEQKQGPESAFAVKGSVNGEDFDPERHERRLLLKAATYHQLGIEKKNGMWVTNVIFDI